jgi:hypothetical protein
MMPEIIMKLRRSRHTGAIFGDRVTGIADVSRAVTYTALQYPAAYVCFLSDDVERQPPGSNENRQMITQQWGVVVGLEATNDIRGQDPAQQVETVRKALFLALYNWAPNYAQNPMDPVEYRSGPLWYGGSKLLEVSRAATFWLFTFGAYSWVCGAEGEGETEEQFDRLGPLERVRIYEDWIDPHDPGAPPSQEYDPPIGPSRGPPPWPSGPEGRIEKEYHVDFPPAPTPRGSTNGREH